MLTSQGVGEKHTDSIYVLLPTEPALKITAAERLEVK